MSFFTEAGKWNQAAWLNYWKALWSAPTQPGFSTLVREGLARQRAMAEWLAAQSKIHMSAELVDELSGQALAQLPTYQAIAAATDDGATLKDMVVTPMLTSADSPIFQIGRAMEWMVINSGIPKQTLGEIVGEKVTKPLKAIAAVTAAAASGLGGILKWAIIGGLAFLAIDAFTGDGE